MVWCLRCFWLLVTMKALLGSHFFNILLKLSFSVIVSLHFLFLWLSLCRSFISYLFLPSPLFVFVSLSSLSSFTPSPFPYSISLLLSVRNKKFSFCEALSKKKFTALTSVSNPSYFFYCTEANNWWRVPFCVHPAPFTQTACGIRISLRDAVHHGLI